MCWLFVCVGVVCPKKPFIHFIRLCEIHMCVVGFPPENISRVSEKSRNKKKKKICPSRVFFECIQMITSHLLTFFSFPFFQFSSSPVPVGLSSGHPGAFFIIRFFFFKDCLEGI